MMELTAVWVKRWLWGYEGRIYKGWMGAVEVKEMVKESDTASNATLAYG